MRINGLLNPLLFVVFVLYVDSLAIRKGPTFLVCAIRASGGGGVFTAGCI